MIWLKSLMLLLGIGGAHLQCFTPDANVPPLDKNADLSGIVDFGLSLYKQLTLEEPSENFIFSPYNIWAALVMVYFGAAGNTQAQLAAGLHVADKPSAHRLSKGLEILYKQQNNGNISLDVASRAYFNESFALLPCVLTLFPDELSILNFNNAKTAAGAINAFVKQKTRGLIPSIVTEDHVHSASMVLVNAVYFKGFWKREFTKSSTQKRDFSVAPSNTVSVDMMSQVADFSYGESSQLGARVLELPYAGSNLSMILLLPNANGNGARSLASVVKKLSSAVLRDAISAGKLQSRSVDVLLPKFKFRGELSENLVTALKKMGIVDIFDGSRADLSQFSSKNKLAVSDIIHKAYVDVNEEGTEAAAATALFIVPDIALMKPPKPVEFHCNKPFVFMVFDRLTNNVLFIGDIKNPRHLQSYEEEWPLPYDDGIDVKWTHLSMLLLGTMIWLKSLMLLLGIGGPQLQCFMPSANIPPLDKHTNLSGIVDFGLSLYKQLTLEKPSENFIFSPYSIWASLVMVYFGAAGNTQAKTAAGAINAFVSQKTRGLISSVVTEDLIRSASMDLVNAVYFKGLWKKGRRTTTMLWVTSLLLLAAVRVAQPQCLTPEDDFKGATYSTDLSHIMDFGLDLYKRLSPPSSSQNFFFSPYSIWNALTLAYFASGGNTQKELEATLKLSNKVSTVKLWKELELFYDRRQKNSSLYTFNLANRAYIDQRLTLRSCVEKILTNEIRVNDFTDKPRSARLINSFVNEVTKGLIREIVTERDLDRILMVIVNAAYFKGTWETQFDPASTRPRNFFISQSQSVPLSMMSQLGRFRYGESSKLGARLLELPYDGDDISMIILLPQARVPFGDRFVNMVNNLNSATLREAIHPSNMAPTSVDILFPKFKFDLELRDELKRALQGMGIVDLFDKGRADLSVFTNTNGLYVDKIIHKAFVEVNEEGTEAAAATALLAPVRSFSSNQPVIFHCDEPFVFLIYDKKTNNVLFLGAIKNPRG
ncbi:uncharacterized protein [Macrobrachium rosenbergii]|uniref:uncharacterized protein n=1 Tax=Macrobrachium rosenbergii TaxID=79674 RepID=UPI0034D58FDA